MWFAHLQVDHHVLCNTLQRDHRVTFKVIIIIHVTLALNDLIDALWARQRQEKMTKTPNQFSLRVRWSLSKVGASY